MVTIIEGLILLNTTNHTFNKTEFLTNLDKTLLQEATQ
jgi:hypothetical protein